MSDCTVHPVANAAPRSSDHAINHQCPSSARPTQLNANMEDAIATTDAKVKMVLTDSIT
jgi:hypothetical protein